DPRALALRAQHPSRPRGSPAALPLRVRHTATLVAVACETPHRPPTAAPSSSAGKSLSRLAFRAFGRIAAGVLTRWHRRCTVQAATVTSRTPWPCSTRPALPPQAIVLPN